MSLTQMPASLRIEPQSNNQPRVPYPRMGRINGEAGESPALSRNCKPDRDPDQVSQAARPGWVYHYLVERGWDRPDG
jgi:hypothetical protein